RFVDGSHLQGPVDHARFASSSFSIGLEGDLDAFPATMIEMAPGDAIFFGPLVIHGSGPNGSSRDRRANTFAYDKPRNQKQGELPEAMHRCGAKGAH
nr:phytanoyl-CoA dioxygenase family protein [Planctomycetota bacterium]